MDGLARLGFQGATHFVLNHAPERIVAALDAVQATIEAGRVKVNNPAGLLRYLVLTPGPIVAPVSAPTDKNYTSGKYGRFVRR